jgi:hypothetical protein
MFYSSYGFGNYLVSAKDAQITEKQAQLVLNEAQLRKYFECSEWYAKDKILAKYCSTDVQNRLNQNVVEVAEKFPNDWDYEFYTNKLKSPNKRVEYIRHLVSIGFVKKPTESGVICYVKHKTT